MVGHRRPALPPGVRPYLGPQGLRPHADASAGAVVVHGTVAEAARGDVAPHVQPVDEELDAVEGGTVGAARHPPHGLKLLPELVKEVHRVEARMVDVHDLDFVHRVLEDELRQAVVVHVPVLVGLHVEEALQDELMVGAHGGEDAGRWRARIRPHSSPLGAEHLPAAVKTVVLRLAKAPARRWRTRPRRGAPRNRPVLRRCTAHSRPLHYRRFRLATIHRGSGKEVTDPPL